MTDALISSLSSPGTGHTGRCCRAWPVMGQFSTLFKNIHRDDTNLLCTHILDSSYASSVVFSGFSSAQANQIFYP